MHLIHTVLYIFLFTGQEALPAEDENRSGTDVENRSGTDEENSSGAENENSSGVENQNRSRAEVKGTFILV